MGEIIHRKDKMVWHIMRLHWLQRHACAEVINDC